MLKRLKTSEQNNTRQDIKQKKKEVREKSRGCHNHKIERKAMIRYRYNYPTRPIGDIKGKETQTRNNWTLMETSLAERKTDSYFPTKWPNGYPKQNDVSDTHIQRRTITKINHVFMCFCIKSSIGTQGEVC